MGGNRLRRRMSRRVLGFGAAAWVGACAGFFFLQDRLVFRPRRDMLAVSEVGVEGLREVAFAASDGRPSYGWYRPPAPGQPTLLYLHGNTGAHPNGVARTRLLGSAPWGLFFPEYRGYGRNGGRPTEAGLLADAEGAADWLAEQGVQVGQVILYGKSLGTVLATRLAARRRFGVLVLDSPFPDLASVFAVHLQLLPVRRLLRHGFDQLTWIGQVEAPLLVMQGARDRLVPPRLGRTLFDAAPAPKVLWTCPRGGHSGILLAGGFERLRTFVAGHLPAGPA